MQSVRKATIVMLKNITELLNSIDLLKKNAVIKLSLSLSNNPGRCFKYDMLNVSLTILSTL